MKTNKMFKTALSAAVIAATMTMGAAQATTFGLDTFLTSKNMGNASDQDELAELALAAGISLTEAAKYDKDDVQFNVMQNEGTTDQWFINVDPAKPGYFMLKFGTGSTGKDDHYFFKNIFELGKLVFSDSQVNNLTGGCGSGSCNIGKLSHYMYSGDVGSSNPGGGEDPLPEPATLGLFGLGLMGLAFGRRKLGK